MAQENHSEIAIIKSDHNSIILIIFAEDHKIDEIHKTIHKTEKADQLVKTISIKISALDQNLMKVIAQTVV